MALMLILFVLPVGIVMYRSAQQSMIAAVQEGHQKTSISYANSVMMDYMRAFSQNPYAGHYDAASLARAKFTYDTGFSTVTFVANSLKHDLYLKAEGDYTGGGAWKSKRAIDAVIHFQSPLTRFGTMINGAFTISGSNVVYKGGMWVNGALSVTGGNVSWNGGPLIVNGSVSDTGGGGSLVGTLYYGGASVSGLAVSGQKYNFVPSTTWPKLDTSYFNANATYVSTTSRTIVFNSTGSYTIVGGATSLVPSNGAILYCSGCNFTIGGVISGRITVVAAGTAGSGTQGNVTVSTSVYYAGASSMSATSANAFAALATNAISFSKAAGNMYVVGAYFSENSSPSAPWSVSGASAASFWLNGSRSNGMTVSGFTGGFTLSYDPNLAIYQPPGLPETPMLVSYRVH